MLAEFGLDEVVDEFAVNYSMGMKKKLGLACALIHDPQVLILDEPINGLDPRAAREVQDRLRQAAASGKTIFMSTHLLDMAEKVCTRVGIIHRGELTATGTLDELRERVNQNVSLEEVFLKVTDEGAAHRDRRAAPAPRRCCTAPWLLIRLRLRRLANLIAAGCARPEEARRQDAHRQPRQEEQQDRPLPRLADDAVHVRRDLVRNARR